MGVMVWLQFVADAAQGSRDGHLTASRRSLAYFVSCGHEGCSAPFGHCLTGLMGLLHMP